MSEGLTETQRGADHDAVIGGEQPRDPAVPTDPAPLAQSLLETIRADEDPDPYLARLAAFEDDELAVLRADRERALAFWLNCYNAGTQLLLERRPGLYESSLRFVRFFRAPALTVGGTALGLDDIEQGILRSRSKYGLGYLPRMLPSSFELRYRLAEPDPRVHFALNCGAASCPAIRSYDHERVTDQLDRATRAYLDGTVDYDPDAGAVRVPRVFLWYRGDFGGTRGIREFLQSYDVLPSGASPTIRYQDWDWSRAAGKFTGGSSPE
ncbi:MAG: hypothetical protein ACI8XM_001331 [Haloarculaceae archaeon]|jgi:hypothetical protein